MYLGDIGISGRKHFVPILIIIGLLGFSAAIGINFISSVGLSPKRLLGVIVLLLLSLAFMVLLILRFEWGLFAFYLAIPLCCASHYITMLKTSYFVLTAETFFLVILFVVWLSTRKRRETSAGAGTSLKLPIIVFLFAGLVSCINSGNPQESFRLLFCGVIQPLILYLVIVSLIRSYTEVKTIIYGLIFATTFAATVSLWNVRELIHVPAKELALSYQPFVGLFSDFAGYGVATIPLALSSSLLLKTSWQKKALLSLATALMIIPLVLQYSRGGWLALLISSVLFLLGSKRGRSLSYKIFPILSIIVFVWFSNIADIFTSRPYAHGFFRFWVRGPGWLRAVVMIKDHPFGIGLGRFHVTDLNYSFSVFKGLTLAHPHNLFLQIGAEMGILALAAFLWFVIVAFSKGIRLVRDTAVNQDIKMTVWGILCGMVGYLTYASTFGVEIANSQGTYDFTGMLYFWTFMGLMIAIDKDIS